jgi:hypothetical protein
MEADIVSTTARLLWRKQKMSTDRLAEWACQQRLESDPGERMEEILLAREEPIVEVGIVGIVAARPVQPSLEAMRGWLAMLDQGLAREEREAIYRVLRDAVPDFRGAAA